MTPAGRPVGEDDLGALVDGRLDPARREAVDAYLASRPEEAARFRTDRELRDRLRDRLEEKAREPIPARLRVATALAARRRLLRRRGIWSAAAVLLLSAGFGSGWFFRDWAGRPGAPPPRAAAVVQEALAAHRTFTVEGRHAVEVKADEAHLQPWLSKRLGRKLVIPDLEAVGFRLIGGRLLPAGSEVAAQLMYGGEGSARITLYVRSGESGEGKLRVVEDKGLSAAYWVEGGYGYALSAAMDRDRLMLVARAAHSEIDGGTSR